LTEKDGATVGSALSDQWESILFSQTFTVAPAVLSQVQTDNDPHWVKSRQQIATTTGVNIALEEEEGKTTPHGAETVGWLAIDPGIGEWSGHLFQAALTADAVTHSWYSFSFGQSFAAAPRFLAALASYDSDESAHLRYRRAQLTVAGAQLSLRQLFQLGQLNNLRAHLVTSQVRYSRSSKGKSAPVRASSAAV